MFQSTGVSPYFNPRPLAGATQDRCRGDGDGFISIHAPLRGRLAFGHGVGHGLNFNPRPLAGATAYLWHNRRPDRKYFNPRPLAGATCRYRWSRSDSRNFNPRPLAGATSMGSPSVPADAGFQSTPPCGGDQANKRLHRQGQISIHAPLRGRHEYGQIKENLWGISIHAPLRGRRFSQTAGGTPARFQSTPPCGGDNTSAVIVDWGDNFNPRPLAGATTYPWFFPPASKDFNPRPLAGATPCPVARYNVTGFQSTPPCGGDEPILSTVSSMSNFNPRPLAGATNRVLPLSKTANDFNPRPLAGATGGRSPASAHLQISIHAPLRGRRG